jgi:hypothetical protein
MPLSDHSHALDVAVASPGTRAAPLSLAAVRPEHAQLASEMLDRFWSETLQRSDAPPESGIFRSARAENRESGTR